jgi:hypothetical protein
MLFSAPMVRALLDGTKTQTRRIIKNASGAFWAHAGWTPAIERSPSWPTFDQVVFNDTGGHVRHYSSTKIPYFVGDRLWVKEAIRHVGGGQSVYIADLTPTVADAWPWKPKALPGMFCPRGLSRITLDVTDVRVQRVQEIDEYDSLAEGIQEVPRCGCDVCRMSSGMCPADAGEQIKQYAELWDHINGKRPRAAWADNPWVWAISFKRVKP